jgi:hypothetical protein
MLGKRKTPISSFMRKLLSRGNELILCQQGPCQLKRFHQIEQLGIVGGIISIHNFCFFLDILGPFNYNEFQLDM